MINITNSNITINVVDDTVSKAKDDLLRKLYYAKDKPTMGEYNGWKHLLHMYYMGDYEGMKTYIESFDGKGAKTRNECIECLNIIIGGNKNEY